MFYINTKLLRRSFQILALFSIHLSAASQAAPMLNGIASYEYLGKERFIAALYLDNPTSDVHELFAAPQHRRMELRIPERFSGRRHVRTWVEGAAINNPAAVLKANAEAMVSFTQLINVSLRPGDRVTIDAPMGESLIVSINGVQQGEIASSELFDVLLRSWVGSVPLSSTFRQDILAAGDIDPAMVARFEGLEPTKERIAFANNLLEPSEAEASENDEQAEQQVASADDSDNTEQGIIDSSAINTSLAVAAPELQAPSLPANPSVPEEETESVTVSAVEPNSQPAEASPAPRNDQEDEGPALQLASLSNESILDDDDEELEGPISVESLLAQQLYHSELLARTYKMVRYPSRAIRKDYEGRVTLQVTIDQYGMLLNTETVDDSGHGLLDRAARDAIKDSSPFPAPPMDLQGESFTFTVPIEFRLE